MTSSPLTSLGTLEERVMEIVWQGDALSVRDVARKLGGKLAYTTVMTTLDRLHKKGLLGREKAGNAFLYRASFSRDEFHRRLVEETVSGLLAKSADPVLAGFVDAAAAADVQNLERLERLLAERRRSGK